MEWKMMWVSFIGSLLAKLSTMNELKQTQSLVIKTGLNKNSYLQGKFLIFCALSPSGSLEYATHIFRETGMENPFLCNTMIRAYCQSVFPIKAIHIYNQMQFMDIKYDSFTFPFVLKACGRASSMQQDDEVDGLSRFTVGNKGMEIHCTALKAGFCLDQFFQNSLLHMYSQCGRLDQARLVFDEMADKTLASWNAMIAGYDRVADFGAADSLLELMPEKNVVSRNALITRHVKRSEMEAARRVFDGMIERDAISWNSIIAGYIQVKDYERALEFFRAMQCNGVQVTEVTLISVLGACAETGALMIGREIHEFLKRNKYRMVGFLGNAMVDMYAKCGSLDGAREVFNGMEMRHVSCWNSMIMAMAVHGFSEEALELFSSMENNCNEAKPNRVTFIGVLIACGHKGLVEEGYRLFHRMIECYNIKPDLKHYGCMVDMLSRCGLIDEAYKIIQTMPFNPNPMLWRILLGSCRIHGNVKYAKEAFQRISDIEFPRDGDRVLLSNIYAESTKWDSVEQVRKDMIDLGVSKKPGFSQVENVVV